MRIPATLLTAGLLLSPAALAADDPDALATEAIAANPSLQALQDREAELRERAGVAGAWSDPVIGIEYSNAPVTSFSLSDHPMSGLQLKVQQGLKPIGWSAAAREVGDRAADAAGHDLEEATLQLDASVHRAWWSLARVRLLRAVTEKHLARTEELLDSVTARFEVGRTGQSSVLRLQVLRDRLDDELGEFERQDVELSAALTRALARAPGSRFETPDRVEPIPAPPARDWAAIAMAQRPSLAAIDSRVEAAESSADLARLNALPDPTLWAGYRLRTVETDTDPGVDLISLGVGIPIPTGSGRRARGDRAANLQAASAGRAQLDASVDAIQADMDATLARWDRAWNKAKTYGDVLVPTARATLETTLSDFSVDKADFASLFDAEVTLLDLDRAWITAAVETHLQQVAATATLGASPGEIQ